MVADFGIQPITEKSPVLSLCSFALHQYSAEHYRRGSRSGLCQDSLLGRPTPYINVFEPRLNKHHVLSLRRSVQLRYRAGHRLPQVPIRIYRGLTRRVSLDMKQRRWLHSI